MYVFIDSTSITRERGQKSTTSKKTMAITYKTSSFKTEEKISKGNIS